MVGDKMYGRCMRGPLESRYLQVHPDATTGLDVCRWFEQRPNIWFTHSEVKVANGCSDRIIREHLPEALNEPGRPLIQIDQSEQAWRYRYVPDASTERATVDRSPGTPHFDDVGDLLAAVSDLDLGHDRGMRPAATFDWRGTRWTVTWETFPERLVEFCQHVLGGGEVHERRTGSGPALSDRPGRPDRLYIYPWLHGAARPRDRGVPAATTKCCGVAQPEGSECPYCGEVVA